MHSSPTHGHMVHTCIGTCTEQLSSCSILGCDKVASFKRISNWIEYLNQTWNYSETLLGAGLLSTVERLSLSWRLTRWPHPQFNTEGCGLQKAKSVNLHQARSEWQIPEDWMDYLSNRRPKLEVIILRIYARGFGPCLLSEPS